MKNAIYAQSGGVTAVINATAGGLIEHFPQKVFAAKNGIIGVLQEELYDTSKMSKEQIQSLQHRAGGAFGSCRYKLPDPDIDPTACQRILEVCAHHNVGYLFYNGGNDSHDTLAKISKYAASQNIDLCCIGLPKTIDNDLAETDFCPGYPSTARFNALATLEIALDLQAMAKSSTKVFVLEVMGRHTGWIAASSILAKGIGGITAPHIVLVPEFKVDLPAVINQVEKHINQQDHCLIVVAEGIDFPQLASDTKSVDAFGHSQLGGIGPKLAAYITHQTGYKSHWSVPDYLQRSARHCASGFDVDMAYKIGQQGAAAAKMNRTGISIIVERKDDGGKPVFNLREAELQKLANFEKLLPDEYIDRENLTISDAFLDYIKPLITTPEPSMMHNGLPNLPTLNLQFIEKKLVEFQI